MPVAISQLCAGQSARISRIEGGRGLMRRLEALGLRPGKTVRKVSSQFMGGPVTVSVDGRQVAMGRGMAAKVIVDPEEPDFNAD